MRHQTPRGADLDLRGEISPSLHGVHDRRIQVVRHRRFALPGSRCPDSRRQRGSGFSDRPIAEPGVPGGGVRTGAGLFRFPIRSISTYAGRWAGGGHPAALVPGGGLCRIPGGGASRPCVAVRMDRPFPYAARDTCARALHWPCARTVHRICPHPGVSRLAAAAPSGVAGGGRGNPRPDNRVQGRRPAFIVPGRHERDPPRSCRLSRPGARAAGAGSRSQRSIGFPHGCVRACSSPPGRSRWEMDSSAPLSGNAVRGPAWRAFVCRSYWRCFSAC